MVTLETDCYRKTRLAYVLLAQHVRLSWKGINTTFNVKLIIIINPLLVFLDSLLFVYCCG